MMDRESICEVIDAYITSFGNSWNLQILYELYNGPKRFNELKRSLTPITQTVLSRHLKSLEDSKLITRENVDDIAYYAISKEGYLVVPSMISTYQWLIDYHPDLRD